MDHTYFVICARCEGICICLYSILLFMLLFLTALNSPVLWVYQALSHQVNNQALGMNTCLLGLEMTFFIQNYARDGLHASTQLKASIDLLYCTYQRRSQSTRFFFSHHKICKWKDMENESGTIYAEIRDWFRQKGNV